MTDAPDMEPAALEAAIATHDRILALPATPDDQKLIAEIIRAYLAARSAPEAGKAVTELRGALYEAKTLLADLRIGKSIHNDRFPDNKIDGPLWNQIGKVVQRCETALASSPAPTGAEPVAWTGSGSIARIEAGLEGHIWPERADAHTIPLYASPQPTGEIAGLVRKLTNIADASRRSDGTDIPLGEQVREAAAALTASEAEAADLRRKLEEHQDAEDKAAREMATVIQGLRNRATAAERKLDEARKALEEIQHECDPSDPDWHVQIEGRTTVYNIAARALSAQVEERE